MAKIMTTGTMQVELIVDDELLEKISKHKWNAFKTGHVQSKIKGRIVRLQRFVMNAEVCPILWNGDREKTLEAVNETGLRSNHV